jgi:hypothetical protein
MPEPKPQRIIQKLEPPPEVKWEMKRADDEKLPKNPIIRFFKIFFLGDGY